MVLGSTITRSIRCYSSTKCWPTLERLKCDVLWPCFFISITQWRMDGESRVKLIGCCYFYNCLSLVGRLTIYVAQRGIADLSNMYKVCYMSAGVDISTLG